MHVEEQHLQSWLNSGRARLVPVEMADSFGAYLDTLPWVGTSIDWSRIPSQSVQWCELSNEGLVSWARSTRAGRHTHLVACFSPAEPALLCEFDDGIRNLDVLFWAAPGVRYVFGADLADGVIKPAFTDFIEYDGGDRLTASG